MRKNCLLMLLLAQSVLVIGQIAIGGSSYQPTGSIKELYELETLPCLRPGVTCRMFSSYDRSGGNDDGFSGTYSKLRIEDGNSVVAEMKGAGVVHRIWMPHAEHKRDGVLGGKGDHIKVYLDGSKVPAIDVPLEDIFAGKLSQFPEPLVGQTLGGFYCYVPIAYRNGCKIVFEGTAVKFYQITYSQFESAEGIETFSMDYSAAKKQQVAKAVEVWKRPEKLLEGSTEKEFNIKLKAGDKQAIDLPQGGNLVRGIYIDLSEEFITDSAVGRIRIFWDDAQAAAVDLPLSHFFGQVFQPEPYQSLFVGKSDKGYYNFMPMAYGKNARIELVAEKDWAATLTVMTKPFDFDADTMTYFHGLYHEAKPAQPKVYYPWLKTRGKGHYFGVYMVTEGPKYNDWFPIWLEGDERFFVNDELLIHGTGSEDYFNCGWYAVEGRLNEPGARALHGFPVYGTDRKTSMRAVCYRWHVSDVVPYDGKITADIEHGPANACVADYSSAVYFYDTRPGTIPLTD